MGPRPADPGLAPRPKEPVNVDHLPSAPTGSCQRAARTAALVHSMRHRRAPLVIESVQPLEPPRTRLVDAAYSCRECGYFYAHPATVALVATIVNGPGQGAGVLKFGGVYFHCGEPMRAAGSEHRTICAPVPTGYAPDAPLQVYLRTRVLRCGCGFQMEIPD